MARDLLWRGMLAGILAGLFAALFALAFAEPRIDAAIAYEAAHSAPATHDHMTGAAAPDQPAADDEIVSRSTQKGVGLFLALTLYGAAVGGLFALLFAYAYGRFGPPGPRSLALLLALGAFVIIVLVPAMKYPPTPPAVGQHETVRIRTAAFFGMILLSLFCAVGSLWIRRLLLTRLPTIDALLGGLFAYVILAALLQRALPVIDEVPADFPATLLWQFRLAGIGAQVVLWAAIGILFGLFAENRLQRTPR